MKYLMCGKQKNKNSLFNGMPERARAFVFFPFTIPYRSRSSERGFGCLFPNSCIFCLFPCLLSRYTPKEASLNRFQLLRPNKEDEKRHKNARSVQPDNGRPDRLQKSGEGVFQERKSLGIIETATLKEMFRGYDYPVNCLTSHLTKIRGEKAEKSSNYKNIKERRSLCTRLK